MTGTAAMTELRLGLGIHWRRQPLGEIVELIDAGEHLGYDCLWITN